jgi:predicted transcriptional regulator
VASGPRSDILGSLQAEVMHIVWELGEATVEDIRDAQPPHRRSAYTTVQTVMNRLRDRGLLERHRQGKAFVYTAKLDEAELVARSLQARLAQTSQDSRRDALLNLVDALDADELDEVARYANRIRRQRKGS